MNNLLHCSSCNIDKPATPRKNWRGFSVGKIVCLKCYFKQYASENYYKIKQYKINWIKADPERFKATQKRYVESGKARLSLERRKAKDPIRFSQKAVERAYKYKNKNPEKYLAFQCAYQRLRRSLLLKPINLYFLKDVTEFYQNCPKGLTVDHIIPLKNAFVTGLHVPWNLQYLERNDNRKKSNSFDFTSKNESWNK